MTDLSPAARAVLIAEAKSRCLREERGCHPDDADWNGCYICVHRRGLAAALRAAADQVVQEEPLHGGDQRWMFERDARQDCRKEFLAIANELDPPSS